MGKLNKDLSQLIYKFTNTIFKSNDIIDDIQRLGYRENKYALSEYPSIIIYLCYIYRNRDFEFNDLEVLNELCKYLRKLILEIKQAKYIDISLCYGLTGIAYTLRYCVNKTGKFKKILISVESILVDLVNQKIDEVLSRPEDVYESDYDIIEGLASPTLYFIDCKNFAKNSKTIEKVLSYFIFLLQPNNRQIGAFISPDKMVTEKLSKKYPLGFINLSLSHGIASVLYILTLAEIKGFKLLGLKESVEEGLKIYFDNILQFNVSGKNYELFSSRILLPNNKLEAANNLSWCYGSLGIINMLYDIAELQNNKFLIEKIINITKKLINIKGFTMPNNAICHGYSGVMLILDKLYRKTDITEFREKSREIFLKIIKSREHSEYVFIEKDIYLRGKIFNKKIKYIDLSLLSGNVGIILALLNHEDKIDSIITRIFFI